MANVSHPLMSSSLRLSWVRPDFLAHPSPTAAHQEVGAEGGGQRGGRRNHQRGFYHQLASEWGKKKKPCRHRLVPGVPGMLTAGWFLQAPQRLTRLPVTAIKKKRAGSVSHRSHSLGHLSARPAKHGHEQGRKKQTDEQKWKKNGAISHPTIYPMYEKATRGLAPPAPTSSTPCTRCSIPSTTLASLQYVLLGWEPSSYLIHITQRRTGTHFGLIFYWSAALFPPF